MGATNHATFAKEDEEIRVVGAEMACHEPTSDYIMNCARDSTMVSRSTSTILSFVNASFEESEKRQNGHFLEAHLRPRQTANPNTFDSLRLL